MQLRLKNQNVKRPLAGRRRVEEGRCRIRPVIFLWEVIIIVNKIVGKRLKHRNFRNICRNVGKEEVRVTAGIEKRLEAVRAGIIRWNGKNPLRYSGGGM